MSNGIIEQVSNHAFRNMAGKVLERNDFILTAVFERHLKEALGIQIRNYEHLGMTDPFYLFVNLVGAVGLAGSPHGPLHYGAPQRIDDDLLQVPEILLERRDEEAVNSAVASIMEVLWNAFGFTERPRY
ncbi:hypothetical protein [Cohnella yongneupensis]|uniref:Uncharacterized protein n=1 Tax=Cohnella yongneupensis TaxID=425006 RepID=A0ABW0QUR3_9BACL